MNEKEREHLMSEIHARIGQPGIVLEWHQVEMRRRYELEWERRNEVERLLHPERLALPALVTVSEPPPAPPAEEIRRRRTEYELVKERKYREYHEVLDNLPEAELKELTAFLARFGRKFPKTARTLSKTIVNFRLFTRTETDLEADKRAYEEFAPRETLWSLEIRDHSRIAYTTPIRIRDCPFSEMKECSVFTGADTLPFLNSLYSFVNSQKSKARPKS